MADRKTEMVITLILVGALSACSSDDSGDSVGAGGDDSSGVTSGVVGGSGGASAGGSVSGLADPAPLEPCPGGGLSAGDHEFDISHDGVDYVGNLLHVPPSYDGSERTGLVLSWHGLTSNASQQLGFSGLNADGASWSDAGSDTSGMIVTYPNGPGNAWDGGACCNSAPRDDVGFARALVAHLQSELCIDPSRIYTTGMSNGGFMSHRLACEASDLFAAAAPVSAVNGMPDCGPERPLPIIQFNGTADTLITYDGTPAGFMGAVESIEGWAERNGCSMTPEEYLTAGATTCERYPDCEDDVDVILCTSEGMGHCWPGLNVCPFGDFTTDINANELMIDIFERSWLPASP